MNRRNLLAGLAAAVTGMLWRKKPDSPAPDYRPELLAGLFELRESVIDEGHRLAQELSGGLWDHDEDGKWILVEPPPAVSEEEKKALHIELVKLEGKREILDRLGRIMWSVIPDYAKQLRQFSGGSEAADRRDDRIRQQRAEAMRKRVPDSFKEGGCFFVTPQRRAEAKAWFREIDQKRLSSRRRLQALAKEKGLLYTGDQS